MLVILGKEVIDGDSKICHESAVFGVLGYCKVSTISTN